MALFKRRKQNTDVLPEEVREYYQSERRERAGLAWLLAVGTLIVTFLIAAVLFFGGRWAYRTVFDNDDNKKDTASQEDKGLRIDEKGNVIGGDQSSDETSSGTPGSSTGTSSTSTSTPSSGGTTAGGSTTTQSSTPSTGPTTLVNTGPGDE